MANMSTGKGRARVLRGHIHLLDAVEQGLALRASNS